MSSSSEPTSSSSLSPPVAAAPSAGVAAFLSAFSALHHHPDVAVKAEANRWLMAFQLSRDAWQVADAVLHTPQLSDEVYYNAANILRHKLLHNYDDLPGPTSYPLPTHSLTRSLPLHSQ